MSDMANTPPAETLAASLRAAVASLGTNPQNLADETGIARTTIQRRLKKPDKATFDEIITLAEALALDAGHLAGEYQAAKRVA